MKFWVAGTLALLVAVAGFSEAYSATRAEPVAEPGSLLFHLAEIDVLLDGARRESEVTRYQEASNSVYDLVSANEPDIDLRTMWLSDTDGAQAASELHDQFHYAPRADGATILRLLGTARAAARKKLQELHDS